MASPGLLGGIIGGAEGVKQVAKSSIEDMRQARLSASSERMNAADIAAKARTAKGKAKKDPKTIKSKRFDEETGTQIEETLERTGSGTYRGIIKQEDVDKFSPIITQLLDKGVPANKVASVFEKQTGGQTKIPSGVVEQIAKSYTPSGVQSPAPGITEPAAVEPAATGVNRRGRSLR